MKEIQVQANPEDWDLSILRAVGVERNGRMLSPYLTTMTAVRLPEPHLTIWRAAVAEFRAIGGGEWDAATVVVTKGLTHNPDAPRPDWMEQGRAPSDPLPAPEPCLHCRITTHYAADNTMGGMTLNLTAPEMIAFFDYFTDEVNWPNPQSAQQA